MQIRTRIIRVTHPLLFWCLLLAFISPLQPAAAESVRLNIQGIEDSMLSNVEKVLTLPAGVIREEKVNLPWLEHFVLQVPEIVGSALEPFGYFSSQTLTELVEEPAGDFELRVVITPGEPVTIETLRIILQGPGKQSHELVQALQRFPLNEGDALRQDLYEQGKQQLKSKAVELGYILADFSQHRIKVFPEQYRAEIKLVLATDELFYFGEISLSGAEEYPEAFLQRFIAFKPDEVFSHRKLNRTSLNYLQADRFEEVLIIPQIEQAEENRVPISVKLTSSLPKRLRPGIGIGTDTGARLTLNYQDVNLRGRGHKLAAEINLAQKRQSFETSYTIPLDEQIKSALIYSVGLGEEKIADYKSRTLFAEVERVYGLGEGNLASIYLRPFHERYEVGNQDETADLVLGGVRYHHRLYNEPVNPTRGLQYRLELRGAHQALGSDISLAQLLGGINGLARLNPRWTLHLRAEAGFTVKKESLGEVPVSLRFFAGGDNSVRGYGYKTQGPEDETGDVVGGDSLLVGSLELERRLNPTWGVAAFYDIGSAFNAFDKMQFVNGAGLGVRIHTPVGPVKLDLARQLWRGNNSWRIHFGFGFDI